MSTNAHISWLCLAALSLASCGGQSGERGSESEATASGEILQRSISDDMLPYDTLKSHPPLEKPRPAARKDDEGEQAEPAMDEAGRANSPSAAAAQPAMQGEE